MPMSMDKMGTPSDKMAPHMPMMPMPGETPTPSGTPMPSNMPMPSGMPMAADARVATITKLKVSRVAIQYPWLRMNNSASATKAARVQDRRRAYANAAMATLTGPTSPMI